MSRPCPSSLLCGASARLSGTGTTLRYLARSSGVLPSHYPALCEPRWLRLARPVHRVSPDPCWCAAAAAVGLNPDVETLRHNAFVLLSKAYTNISVESAAAMLGLSPQETVEKTTQAGWTYQADTKLLIPKVVPEPKIQTTSALLRPPSRLLLFDRSRPAAPTHRLRCLPGSAMKSVSFTARARSTTGCGELDHGT